MTPAHRGADRRTQVPSGACSLDKSRLLPVRMVRAFLDLLLARNPSLDKVRQSQATSNLPCTLSLAADSQSAISITHECRQRSFHILALRSGNLTRRPPLAAIRRLISNRAGFRELAVQAHCPFYAGRLACLHVGPLKFPTDIQINWGKSPDAARPCQDWRAPCCAPIREQGLH